MRIRRGRQHDRPHTIAQALDDPDLSKEIGLRMRSKVLAQIAPAQMFYDFCLDDHVPADHLLRRIDQFLLQPVIF